MSVQTLLGYSIEREPILLFDEEDTSAIHSQPLYGLRTYGPYTKKKPKINVGLLYSKDVKQQMEQLVKGLSKGAIYFPGGMEQLFYCDFVITQTKEIPSIQIQDYEKGVKEFIASDNGKSELVLAYVPQTNRFEAHTPYYRCKAIFATEGYPTQMVTDWTFRNIDWSYLNLACAIFSKAGGIPWVLYEEMPKVDIILGLSISNIVSEWYTGSELKRYVAYVNVFDKFGRWRFYHGSAEPYEKDLRERQIKEMLEGAITKFEAQAGQKPRNISIHYWKRFSALERRFAAQILDELLEEYHISFIEINDDHPYRAYDKKSEDWSFKRGHYVSLSPSWFLMSTTGETELSRKRMGTPKLLSIRFRQYPDQNLSIHDVAQHILSLTRLNWATATPMIREPISLSFSRDLAWVVSAVSNEEWEGVMSPRVNQRLSCIPWFI